MEMFTSIFHEENIPMPVPNKPSDNPLDDKVNMNLTVSVKNLPKVKTLINQQSKDDKTVENRERKEAMKKESVLFIGVDLI